MPDEARKLFLAAALCLIAVATLAVFVYGSDSFARLDDRVSDAVLAADGSRADSLAHFASNAANPAPLAVILLLLIALGAYWRRYPEVVAGAVVLFGANLTTQLIKLALAHPRLQAALGADHLVPIAFPSGHTTAAASAAFAGWLVSPPEHRRLVTAIGAAYALVVAVGVIVAGWHYVSDVLGAWLIVAAWGLAALAVLRWFRSPLPAAP